MFKAAGKGIAAVKRHAGKLDEAVGALSHADDAATATATGVRESIEEASSVLAKEGGGVAKGGVTSFSEGPALGGALYSEGKFQQLVPYLNKRGVSVFETTGNARYVARADGTGTMYLPANPTTLQVKHELSHFLDHRRLGFERYSEVRSSARESWVRSRLMQNRSWDDFNPAEQDFIIRYPDKVLNEGR